jgi:putative oxidoreductase
MSSKSPGTVGSGFPSAINLWFQSFNPHLESAMSTSSVAAGQPPSAAVSITTRHEALKNLTEASGRVLLALLFLLAGVGKLGAYHATAAYMSSVGVPAGLLPPVIAIELLGSVAIIVGWKTRAVALLLAGFSVVTALIFHRNFGDQTQMIMFLKNFSIAGGFLLLVANGAGPLSLDRRLAR